MPKNQIIARVILFCMMMVSYGSLNAAQKSDLETMKWLESYGKLSFWSRKGKLSIQLSPRKNPETRGITAKKFVSRYSCKMVKNLFILGIKPGNSDFTPLKRFSNLETLRIRNTKLTTLQAKVLGSFSKLYDITLIHTGITDEAFQSIGDLKALRKVWIRAAGITGSGFRHLVGLKRLHTVFLDCKHLNSRSLLYISKLPSLKSVSLYGNVNDKSLVYFQKTPKLVHLGYKAKKIFNKTLQVLSGFANWTKLDIYNDGRWSYSIKYKDSLSLRTTKVNGNGFKYLAGSKLRRLTLPKNTVDDDLKKLKSIPGIINVRVLKLSEKITHRGLIHLHFLKNLKKLQINDNIKSKHLLKIYKAIPGISFARGFYIH